jgi:uncharacterized protein DUF3489
MMNAKTEAIKKTATLAAPSAHSALEKDLSKRAAATKKGAPKGRRTARGSKAPRAPKKTGSPRAQSKGAKILEMIRRAKGATLAEIMKATDWQAHSVRSFVSSTAKKHGIRIESMKNDAGRRFYKIAKQA